MEQGGHSIIIVALTKFNEIRSHISALYRCGYARVRISTAIS